MSTSVNLLNIDPTQTQFDGINSAINTINSELSNINDEIIAINSELNLKTSAFSYVSVGIRLHFFKLHIFFRGLQNKKKEIVQMIKI